MSGHADKITLSERTEDKFSMDSVSPILCQKRVRLNYVKLLFCRSKWLAISHFRWFKLIYAYKYECKGNVVDINIG